MDLLMQMGLGKMMETDWAKQMETDLVKSRVKMTPMDFGLAMLKLILRDSLMG